MAVSVSPWHYETLNSGTSCAKSRQIREREANVGAKAARSRPDVPPARPGAPTGRVRKTLRHTGEGCEGCGPVDVGPSAPERGPIVVSWWRRRNSVQKTLNRGTGVRDARLE